MEDQDGNSFEPYDVHHRCQALSKQRRKQCGRAAAIGKRTCKFRGGASLVGPDHPRYRGKSRYLAKYVPRRLERRLVEAQQQPDLATLHKELGLLDFRLTDLLQRLGPDTPETVRDAIWPEVYGLIPEVWHAEVIHVEDISRFKRLNVAAETWPILWYPVSGFDWEISRGKGRAKIGPVKNIDQIWRPGDLRFRLAGRARP